MCVRGPAFRGDGDAPGPQRKSLDQAWSFTEERHLERGGLWPQREGEDGLEERSPPPRCCLCI